MERLTAQWISPELIVEMRCALGKTRSEFAELLAVPTETVRRYEQGLAHPPPRALRILTLLLASHRLSTNQCTASCWEVRGCAKPERERCPAYRLNRGQMCWLLTGSFCAGQRRNPGEVDNHACLDCTVLKVLCGDGPPVRDDAPGPGRRASCGMPRPARALAGS